MDSFRKGSSYLNSPYSNFRLQTKIYKHTKFSVWQIVWADVGDIKTPPRIFFMKKPLLWFTFEVSHSVFLSAIIWWEEKMYKLPPKLSKWKGEEHYILILYIKILRVIFIYKDKYKYIFLHPCQSLEHMYFKEKSFLYTSWCPLSAMIPPSQVIFFVFLIWKFLWIVQRKRSKDIIFVGTSLFVCVWVWSNFPS